MAVRRPPAPRLRSGRPGAPRPLHPAGLPSAPPAAAPPVPSPAASASPPGPTSAADPGPTSAAGAAPAQGPRRRALLLAGSAAAVIAVPVASAGLLTRHEGDALPAASSSGGGSSTAGLTSPFPDVPADAPGLEAMLWAAETGVQPAREDGDYAPDAPVTRGALAVALHRFAGSPALPAAELPALITDLGPDPAVSQALLWLHGRGAVWGDHELRVHPEAEATRADAAQMVATLLRPALAGLGLTWDPASAAALADAASLPALPDPGDPDSSAADVHWLAAAGMLVPSRLAEDSGWDGEQPLSREDVAIALHRADQVIASVLP